MKTSCIWTRVLDKLITLTRIEFNTPRHNEHSLTRLGARNVYSIAIVLSWVGINFATASKYCKETYQGVKH